MRILVVRHRFLGDTILTVPFLRGLRHLYPEAHITVLVAPVSGELLRNCPLVDELLVYDTTDFHKYETRPPHGRKRSFWQYVGQLRQQRFDMAYILKRSFSSAALAYLAGIPRRIGFDTEMRGCLLTERVHFDPGRHEVRNFLAHLPMSAEDTGPARREVCFWPTDAEDQRARSLTASLPAGRRLLVHAPAAHPAKMWRPEAWSHLLGKLREEGYVLIASGSPEDSRLYSEIGVEFELDLCRAGTTLRDNVAVYGHCDLAVCVDSGPMHLAAAMGIPGVALFGPSDPNRWQPWSDSWRVTQGLPELRPAEVHRQLRELESDLASARR